MEYEETKPDAPLLTDVACLWSLRGASAGAPFEPALPDGRPELLFNFGDPFEQLPPHAAPVRQPPMVLVGQITRPFLVRPTGRVDLLAVRFEAHGAGGLHDDLSQLTDRWCTPDALLDAELPTLHGALRLHDAATRLPLLQAWLHRHAARRRKIDAVVIGMVQAIRASHGAASVDQLAAAHGVTLRTVQRRFVSAVGISPKKLARITRFQRVFRAWRDDPASLARTAALCGYCDQSHLVRDFRDFAGESPAALLGAMPGFTGLFLP